MDISTILWVLGALWLLGAVSSATQRSKTPLRSWLDAGDAETKERERMHESLRQQNEADPWWNPPS